LTAPLTTNSVEIDLGLQLPPCFELQSLFPKDRLLRLHPNWFISDFRQDAAAFTASIKDYVTEKEFPLSGSVIFDQTENELMCITLTGTINISIRFQNRGNSLHVQIASPEGRLDADDPLLLWIRAIREYLRCYVKTTPVTWFFRFVMNRMVLQMNPSQRKICLMLAKITIVEILVIIFIVVAYVIFVF